MANKLTIVLPKMEDDDIMVGKEVDDIVEASAANVATFPDPDHILDSVKAANKTFKESIPSERNSSIALQEIKMQNKEAMLTLLTKWAAYVLLIANGNRSIAALSGFRLSKATSTKKTQGVPVVKSSSPGVETGTARIALADKAGNSAFIVFLKVGSDEYRMVDAFHDARSIIKNLPSGEATIHIVGRRGNKYSPPTGDFTVRVF